ncbi:transforming growth factor-beta receptor-associated protein 1-like [Tubulanus polymorphus]|uniref:transforming growth factor-beta receptor-associated protein 1-like n=1 Tax=Tubulanus polymorphus TaxID=672921 RepID=UPI003DA33FB6
MSIKAFELVAALERSKLASEKAHMQIECIECCGKNLYIGTSECFVMHYGIEERQHTNGRTSYHVEKKGHKYLAVKKPVVQLKAAIALNRILVLCDNTLNLLNMLDLEPIVSGAKIKGVTSFCMNHNPTTRNNLLSVEIAVALKRKCVQIYTVTQDKVVHMRDVNLPELPLTMAVDGFSVCVACTSHYLIANYDTGQMQDLFPYESEFTTPITLRISREEFLLSGPSALGMFVTSAGISQRPPLQWGDRLTSIAYHQPYILALNDEFITIHSIIDQQQKQTIPFQGGVFLGVFEDKILVASSKEIYALVPVAWEKQIQSLLVDKRVSEALDLAKTARKSASNRENFMKLYKRIQQQAGFIEFCERHFDEATELFISGKIDVREIITLYPGLLPLSSNFTRVVPALHDIADINQYCRGDQSMIKEYKRYAMNFLEKIRARDLAKHCQKEVDSALLKLYAEMESPELIALIATEHACDMKDSEQYLISFGRFNALGLMYRFQGNYDRAMQVWAKIVDGEYSDESFLGLDFIIEFLANLEDHEVVWKYADWVLDKDENKGVKIFTERPASETGGDKLQPDAVIDYLHRFPSAVIEYLEYLVFTQKLEKEKYHTHLAVLYLEQVLEIMKNPNHNKQDLDFARSKLQQMLQRSNLYRIQLLLGKVKETEMYAEMAILYGKLEEHDKAIRILVHKLKDYARAERYCIVNSDGKDHSYRRRLFQILLGVYLDPSYERSDLLISPAISLLNNCESEFDSIKILQLLPDDWSVGLLSQFLTQSVRLSLNRCRTTRVERMLARGENLQVKQQTLEMCKGPIVLKDDRRCAVCGHAFNDSTFVRYPNGVIAHIHCAKNRYVCPVTGRLFSSHRRDSSSSSSSTSSDHKT